MKLIVLAAGQGRRLLPLTEEIPKAMVPLHGVPLLAWQIRAAREAGVGEIVVVGGHRADRLPRDGVTTVLNEAYETTNMVASLRCARDHFDDDFVASYGDIAYDAAVLRRLIDSDAPISVVVDRRWRPYWERRFADPLSDAETLRIDGRGLVVEIGRKAATLEEIEGQYIGLTRFRGEGVSWVRDALESEVAARPSIFMTDLLQALIDRGRPVRPVFVDGGWLEIDSPSDRRLAEQLSEVSGGRLWVRRDFPVRRFPAAPVVWITGLPASGKTAVARALVDRIEGEGTRVLWIDGDAFRNVLGDDLGYDPPGRLANARRIAAACRWIADQGIPAVCSTVSLYREIHDWNRRHIERYFEVYLRPSPDLRASRDVKGVRGHEDPGYEEPRDPDLVLEGRALRRDPAEIARAIRERLPWPL